jgi:RNA polymerase sigma-70 factor, ECF subfamily
MTTTHPAAEMDSADTDVMRYRPRVLGLAYRMLGDVHEAEDVVQEGYLRWYQADRREVQKQEGWLMTVVGRLAVDRLRSASRRRETYPGPWLPEPVATAPPPDADAERESDLSIALLAVLERLAPEERAAFVLREVFDAGYDEIAGVLDRSEAAARQVVHRARQRVRAGRLRFPVAASAHGDMLQRFVAALAADDQPALLALLAPEVTFTSDGGGKVSAARNVVTGSDPVARMLLGLAAKHGARLEHRLAWLNGQPALLSLDGERVENATMLDLDGDRVTGVYIIRNPDKLGRVHHSPRME